MKQLKVIANIYEYLRFVRCFAYSFHIRKIAAEVTMPYDTIMIIAPHPDDEALSCGGLISMARNTHKQVFVVFMTDGGESHQGCCCSITSEKLGRIRRDIAIRANRILGVDESNLTWLNLCDRNIPDIQHFDFERACNLLVASLRRTNPQVVFAPHFMDIHPDHVASAHITQAALASYNGFVDLYYYPIWMVFQLNYSFLLNLNNLKFVKLNIAVVQDKKKAAIRTYMRDINPVCKIPYSGKPPKFFLRFFQDSFELFFADIDKSTIHQK